ncbi:MAG TPA: hypothetical protein VNF75_08290 [Candidatus Dormibacteraeota bacterium]|nr:hypothetical protein [Candidatus Dormibacteraeota bacterium]
MSSLRADPLNTRGHAGPGLGAAGPLLVQGCSYAKRTVSPRLSAQNIYFHIANKGETMRRGLLHAYALWTFGQIPLVASVISFLLAAAMSVLSALKLTQLRGVPAPPEWLAPTRHPATI